MKLQYLGTAAAEGIPGLFCQCENCKRAMKLGGKNLRTRSQALVDDTLLIDFPPDTFLHTVYHGLDITKIRTCIVTHSHSDHLYAPDLEMRKVNFAILDEPIAPFTIYADEHGYDTMVHTLEESRTQRERVLPVRIDPGQEFMAQGYRILPLRASHSPKTSPVVYVIEKDSVSFGYFHDTSLLPEESLNKLAQLRRPMKLVSLDCTEGTLPIDPKGHMNLRQCIQTRHQLLSIGAADEHTIFVLNHFSHNGENTLYDDLSPIAEEEGFVVSYDGMELSF